MFSKKIKIKAKVTFPYTGKYNDLMAEAIRDMGLDVIKPSVPNKRIIAKGVEYSPEQLCLPYKISLGSLFDSLDKGANVILHGNTGGWCRFRCYYTMQEKVLQKLGYNFDKIILRGGVLSTVFTLFSIKRLEPNFSIIRAIIRFAKFLKEVRDIDEKCSGGDMNIGIVGEIYTQFTPEASMGYEKILIDNGANVDLSLDMTHLMDVIKTRICHTKFTRNWNYKRQAKKYFNEKIAGHGFDSIYNTLKYINEKYDGVIHVAPMFCMPENTVEQIIQQICNEYRMPLLTLKFDDAGSPTLLRTQIETFCEMIKRRKQKNENRI